ncbi:hypothetical protein BDW62DRAFT_60655 [Aspergillus aurantiobrunneus]
MTDSTDAGAPPQPDIFTEAAKELFIQHLKDHPSCRRLSSAEKKDVIEWLTDPDRKPSSQREYSRRSYVRHKFIWDGKERCLWAKKVNNNGKNRIVVAQEDIAEVVQTEHRRNHQAGLKEIWKNISTSYHGILQSDVKYLLPKCRVCRGDPPELPKNPESSAAEPELGEGGFRNKVLGSHRLLPRHDQGNPGELN